MEAQAPANEISLSPILSPRRRHRRRAVRRLEALRGAKKPKAERSLRSFGMYDNVEGNQAAVCETGYPTVFEDSSA